MFVQPSSLVFLVIIAIWAAYLLQHWVRRREYLATARSVDRFSDAMHVLELRHPLPEPDLSASDPRSYAVSPARPSRPEVVVKSAHPPTAKAPSAAVRPTRMFHVLAGVSARRLRGLSLLASLSVAVVALPLGATSVLSWWGVMAAVAILVADVAWLRYVALSESAIRRFEAQAPGPDLFADAQVDAAAEVDDSGELAKSGELAWSDEVFEQGEVAERAERAAQTDFPAEVDPSGWAPVPVPPPTYTLKARAEPPMPIPAFVELTEYAPVQPLTVEDAMYEAGFDGSLQGRRASGA